MSLRACACNTRNHILIESVSGGGEAEAVGKRDEWRKGEWGEGEGYCLSLAYHTSVRLSVKDNLYTVVFSIYYQLLVL